MGRFERENELAALEARLSAFHPGPGRLDRDRVMYLAGRASVASEPLPGRRRRWAWPAAFSAMTAVAAVLLAVLLAQPATDGISPPGGGDHLAREAKSTDGSRELAEREGSPPAVVRPWGDRWPGEPDLDALLAAHPAGRHVRDRLPWKDASATTQPAPSVSAPPPRMPYLEQRRMLLEDLIPGQPRSES